MKTQHLAPSLAAALAAFAAPSSQAQGLAQASLRLDVTFTSVDNAVVAHSSGPVTIHAYAENDGVTDPQNLAVSFSGGEVHAEVVPVYGDYVLNRTKSTSVTNGEWRFQGSYFANAVINSLNVQDPLARAYDSGPIRETFTLSGPGTDVVFMDAAVAVTLRGGQATSNEFEMSARASIQGSHNGPDPAMSIPVSSWQIQNGDPDINQAFTYSQPGQPIVKLTKGAGKTLTVTFVIDPEGYTFGGEPLAISLVSMSASLVPRGVLVAWQTASEPDNVGFRIHRASTRHGRYVPVSGLIPAQGGPSFGAYYTFLDSPVPRQRLSPWYRLEDIDQYGVSTLHRPVRVDNWPTIPGPTIE